MRVVGPVVGAASCHSLGPVHSYPSGRNAPLHASHLVLLAKSHVRFLNSSIRQASLPRQLPVLNEYLDIQNLSSDSSTRGESLVASVDSVHGGVWINKSNALPPRMTYGTQHPILNSLEELARLAKSARPLAARPDVRQNGIWIVPVEDTHSVEAATLSTLDEMLRSAKTIDGARGLADGETEVLERLGYFLQSEHDEVSFRAAQIVFELCSHANHTVSAAVRFSYSLMDALVRISSPDHDAPDCTRKLVLKAYRNPASGPLLPQAAEDIDALLAPRYPLHAGLACEHPPALLSHNMALRDENEALRYQNFALRSPWRSRFIR